MTLPHLCEIFVKILTIHNIQCDKKFTFHVLFWGGLDTGAETYKMYEEKYNWIMTSKTVSHCSWDSISTGLQFNYSSNSLEFTKVINANLDIAFLNSQFFIAFHSSNMLRIEFGKSSILWDEKNAFIAAQKRRMQW